MDAAKLIAAATLAAELQAKVNQDEKDVAGSMRRLERRRGELAAAQKAVAAISGATAELAKK